MTTYESYMVTCGGTVLCTAHSATAARSIAQTFTVTTPHTVTDIDLKIYKSVGTIVGNTYISLYRTVSGLPTTQIANTSVTILDADLTDQDSQITNILLPLETSLDAGVYAIVVETDIGPVFWRGQTTIQAGSDPYTGGIYCYNSGSGWIVPADGSDCMFTIYGNPIGTTYDCTNPNGYLNDVICGDLLSQDPNSRYSCTSTGWSYLETCEFGCKDGNCNAEPPIPPPPGIDTKMLLVVGGIVAATAIAFYLAGGRKRRK